MKSPECPRERETAAAAVSGAWPPALSEHAAACPVCREVATVCLALSHLPVSEKTETPLPPATRIWWKAQLAERRSAIERASRPMRIVQTAGGIVAAAAASAAASAEWPRIAAWAAQWQSSWPAEWRVLGFTPGLAGLFALGGACLLAAVLLAARKALPLED
jgi:hypothetical protein